MGNVKVVNTSLSQYKLCYLNDLGILLYNRNFCSVTVLYVSSFKGFSWLFRKFLMVCSCAVEKCCLAADYALLMRSLARVGGKLWIFLTNARVIISPSLTGLNLRLISHNEHALTKLEDLVIRPVIFSTWERGCNFLLFDDWRQQSNCRKKHEFIDAFQRQWCDSSIVWHFRRKKANVLFSF